MNRFIIPLTILSLLFLSLTFPCDSLSSHHRLRTIHKKAHEHSASKGGKIAATKAIKVLTALLSNLRKSSNHKTLDSALRSLGKDIGRDYVPNPLGLTDDESKHVTSLDFMPMFTGYTADFEGDAKNNVKKIKDLVAEIQKEAETQASLLEGKVTWGFTLTKVLVWTAGGIAAPFTAGASLAVAAGINVGVSAIKIGKDVHDGKMVHAGAGAAALVIGAIIPGGGIATDIAVDISADVVTDIGGDVLADATADAISDTVGHIAGSLAGEMAASTVANAVAGDEDEKSFRFLQFKSREKSEKQDMSLEEYRECVRLVKTITDRRMDNKCIFADADGLPTSVPKLKETNQDDENLVHMVNSYSDEELEASNPKVYACLHNDED